MKLNLEVECSAWLNEDGTIDVGIWFGRDCDAPLEDSFLLKEMIDSTLESMKVGNKISDHHFDDVEKLLTSFNGLYEYAKNQAEELGWS